MSSIGPALPPHLAAKRKREAEKEAESRPATTQDSPRSSSPDGSDKRRRVMGPAPPPAALEELPSGNAEGDDDSSSEDEWGPAPAAEGAPKADDTAPSQLERDIPESDTSTATNVKRDEWMMIPPKQDDLAARMDPTKIRARKFNTGKGAKAPNQNVGGSNDIWTETPEQKLKRLENQVMGVSDPTSTKSIDPTQKTRSTQDEQTERRIREHTEKTRGKSMYEKHKKGVQKEKEDDPSKRAFDWDKDMDSRQKVGHAQRKEMVNRAADFGSKFSKGSYL